ncbi:shikimate kinase [uncultured Ruegeria sp.]|uniref:shikimate kinase n=1 Tax=uncultured Ruegeria sp. TaxID=259304 RepID=UPI002601F37A|nr:shikimate kinase [uncultured Ruegeria sp.]
MDRHIFLIGPGGVGKTSSGPHLARLIGCEFVDLDELFMSGPGHIGRYIKEHGYAQYVRENSKLFFEHIVGRVPPCVCALSSGFLIAETEVETVELNSTAVRKEGFSILLLPHADPDECAKIVAIRQAQRGLSLRQEIEHSKFLARLPVYRSLADQVTVFQGQPEGGALSIFTELYGARI